ncbi:glycosyltransferase family 2 protein [Candidatus Francisella endociliophora]|uniref:glycosyltransferase family 2 protein n=1 Tax=Candidatus Francisella endociliophora TaxID=653937 RepID=UPI0006950B6A|nr:glycosyltransferase family 2 protein [Francisella sp. FSC1006]
MNKPLISVVMPVYNAEKYVGEAIESVLNQTFKDFEFIIINDGSSDKSLDIIKKYQKIDDRFVLIDRENKGLVFSLNEGVILAKGKYIVRMDADDISLPKRFSEQVEFMERNHKVGVCGTWIKKIGEDYNECFWKPQKNDKKLKSLLLYYVPFAHPSVIIRRKVLINNNIFYNHEYKNIEDYKLWVDLYKYTEFSNIQKVLLYYRVHDNSVTQKAEAVENINERRRIFNQIVSDLLKSIDPSFFRTNEECFIHYIPINFEENLLKLISIRKVAIYFDKVNKLYSQRDFFDLRELNKLLCKMFFKISYFKIKNRYKELLNCIVYKRFWVGFLHYVFEGKIFYFKNMIKRNKIKS